MTLITILNRSRHILMLGVVLLMSACRSAGDTGTSDLFDAVEDNDVNRVRTLLQEGADPDDRIRYSWFVQPSLHEGSHYNSPRNGTTALMVASAKGSVTIVTALLVAGANPNHKTRIGKTALMFAAEKCHLDVMKLLLSKNADIAAVATGGTNEMGADLSGSVLRFALACALWKEGTPDVAYYVLDHLKPGDLPDNELAQCLDWRNERLPHEMKQRIAALHRS